MSTQVHRFWVITDLFGLKSGFGDTLILVQFSLGLDLVWVLVYFGLGLVLVQGVM